MIHAREVASHLNIKQFGELCGAVDKLKGPDTKFDVIHVVKEDDGSHNIIVKAGKDGQVLFLKVAC